MWTQWLTWLRKTAPKEPHRKTAMEEADRQHIERLMNGLRSPEPKARRRADMLVARILADGSGYETVFIVALLEALAEQINPDMLELVPRYVPLLADASFAFGRLNPTQVAAQACLAHWQAQQQVRQNERAQTETLLRAADRPASEDTLLRPASGTTLTEPDQLLRSSGYDKKD